MVVHPPPPAQAPSVLTTGRWVSVRFRSYMYVYSTCNTSTPANVSIDLRWHCVFSYNALLTKKWQVHKNQSLPNGSRHSLHTVPDPEIYCLLLIHVCWKVFLDASFIREKPVYFMRFASGVEVRMPWPTSKAFMRAFTRYPTVLTTIKFKSVTLRVP